MQAYCVRCWLLLAFFSLYVSAAETTAYKPVPLADHWKLTVVDETVFNSKVFVAETGDTAKPTVLLVHGMGQVGLKDWITVIPALEQHYHVVALDLPGFGRSDKPAGKYSPTNYAKVLHQIKQQYSRDPVYVVGHSMGGAVALRYTALYPDDVQGTILVAAAGILERTAFVKHSIGALIDGQQMPAVLDGARSLVEQYAGSLVELMNQVPDPTRALGNYQLLWGQLLINQSNANAGLALVEEDFSAAIFNSQQPFTIIWGAKDRIAPLRTGKLLAGQLANAELKIIDDAEHVPMLTHSGHFNTLLLSALAGQQQQQQLAQNAAAPVLEALTCRGERGRVYSGHYRRITIDDCRAVVLKDVTTESLVVNASQLEIENLTIVSEEVAMVVDQSVVMGTNVRLQGETGLQVANSRIDFAGAAIDSRDSGIVVEAATELVFSISRLNSAGFTGSLHGQYRVATGTLDSQLAALAKQ